MVKRGLCVFMVLLLAFTLCSGALAADNTAKDPGIYGINTEAGCTLTPQTENSDVITPVSANVGEDVDDFYPNAVKAQVSFTGLTAGTQYLLLVLSGSSAVPTEDNIVYIDQNAADAEGKLSFVIYPNAIGKDTYTVYLAAQGGTGLLPKATFTGYQSYKLGDVDDDGEFTATDALYALQMSVGNGTWTDTQKFAANVDGDQLITATDALFILQRSVGNRTSFDS